MNVKSFCHAHPEMGPEVVEVLIHLDHRIKELERFLRKEFALTGKDQPLHYSKLDMRPK